MRKKDREVKQFESVLGIIERCQVVRLGLKDGAYPYIVPLSFGYEVDDGRLCVYFHCATEGRKLDMLRTDNRVCLEWDILHGYVETGHSVTADYESVIAFGRAERCEGDKKVEAIKALLEHTGYANYSAEQCAAMPIVDAWCVECEEITGKKRFLKK